MTNLKKIVVELSVIVVLISNSSSLNAALFPDISLPDEELLEILETGPGIVLGLSLGSMGEQWTILEVVAKVCR